MSDYDDRVWSDPEKVSDEQVEESENAERTVEAERKFIKKRKEAIRKKLKEYDMTQQDLGKLLDHPKSYISELMNGVSQFSMKDLVLSTGCLG
jgi:predicted XRE-type DNA-binding protein